jgi:ELWxxDGT repeat protein
MAPDFPRINAGESEALMAGRIKCRRMNFSKSSKSACMRILLLLSSCVIVLNTTAQSIQRPFEEKSYSALGNITPADNFFFFTLNDDEHGLELWRSDGTRVGTEMIKDIHPGKFSSAPSHFQLMDRVLFFVADDGIHGSELWRSDGTSEGTYLLKDISTGTTSSAIDFLFQKNGILFATIVDDVEDAVVWQSDGTSSGTIIVNHPDKRGEDEDMKHEAYIVFKNRSFFVGARKSTGLELRSSVRGVKPTLLVKDIHPGIGNSYISGLTHIGDFLYFSAYDGIHGSEIWKSDGTTAGTEMVKDILPGALSSLPRNFSAFRGKVYFSIVAENGIELWTTDGTADGTHEVFPGVPVEPSVDKLSMGHVNNSLEKLATPNSYGEEGSALSVHVFPNPFHREFNTHVNSSPDEKAQLTLTDISSRETYRCQGKVDENIFEESILARGTYLVRIRTRKNMESIRLTKVD